MPVNKKSAKKAIRPLALVKFAGQTCAATPAMKKEMPLIYLGEIPNMPGHGVFLGNKSGKLFSGYHLENFAELTSDEV